MAEVVGLAMAAIGLVSQVIELSSFISFTIKNSKRYESDADILRVKFDHEHQSVKYLLSFLFGENLSPDEGVFKILPKESQINVLEIIIYLRKLLSSYTTIESKYGLGSPEPSDAPDIKDILQIKSQDSKRSQEKGSSLWTKIRWAISGKNMLEELIQDLQGWNNMVRRVIKDVVFIQMQSASQIQSIEANPATKASGMGPSVKLRRLIVGGEVTQNLEVHSRMVILPQPQDVKTAKGLPREARQVALLKAKPTDLDGSPVIVEYKKYDDNMDSDPVAINKVQKLAALLHGQEDSGFRVLPCRGYFNDIRGSRFGFIFDIPEGVLQTPTSLHNALSRSECRSQRPSVTLRLKIAHSIAESLYLLHTVGWVHKSLRSENILFFEPNNAGDNPNLMYESPWLSGFEYSRMETDFSSRRLDNRVDRNLYKHPKRWGLPRAKSTKIHDIYSLGVVLLEIGIWCRVQSLQKDGFESFRSNPTGASDYLRNFVHGRVGYSMGDKYEKIVLMCLEGEETAFGVEDDDKADTKLQKEFREKIMEVLEVASQTI